MRRLRDVTELPTTRRETAREAVLISWAALLIPAHTIPSFPRTDVPVMPFDFGHTFNFHSNWAIEGFTHPDAPFASYPANFTLYRTDNQQPGGCYEANFDAWMTPCPN